MTTEAAWIQADALGPDPVLVRSLEGRDELNQQYAFRAHVELPGVISSEDLEQLLKGPARLSFRQDVVELNRFFAIVSDVTVEADSEHARTDLFLELRPLSWLMSLRRGTEIFMGQTIPETIREKLISAGLDPERDFGFVLHDTYPRREFTVQHEETDLSFVMRLAEDVGLASCFQDRDGHDGWVFTDSSATFAPGPRPYLHVRTRADHPAAFNVRRTLRRVPSDVVAHDYNYRTPRLALSAERPVSAPAALGTWVEFANDPKTETEVDEVARLRAEELAARHDTTEGMSTDASLRAGRVVELRDAAGGRTELLITHVWYAFRAEREGSVGWENRFRGIPVGVRFRPPRLTPMPKVSGLMHGIVDGAVRGQYAELDDEGRYRLRMAYDRSGRSDLSATHPVRMMQPHAGAQYGMHFPLRPGADVLVGFVNGDPDRPIIVGTAPNPSVASPVVQSNQTQNVLRSGSRNELVMEDLLGSERVRVHSPTEDSTVQIGALEEPENGILLKTDANVSAASTLSNNTLTSRHAVLADKTTTIAGTSAVLVAGLPAIGEAARKGMSDVSAVDSAKVQKGLERLAAAPPREEEEATDDETEEP
ncbi:MAG: type VI secretion system tip protein VgrG, partial [Myxococcales bacterium]|nr:type VI secretion system tip protein VgrG [Myxococcales bacterium]